MENLKSLKKFRMMEISSKMASLIKGGDYCYTGAGSRIVGPNGATESWSNDAVHTDGTIQISGSDAFKKGNCITSIPGNYDYKP